MDREFQVFLSVTSLIRLIIPPTYLNFLSSDGRPPGCTKQELPFIGSRPSSRHYCTSSSDAEIAPRVLYCNLRANTIHMRKYVKLCLTTAAVSYSEPLHPISGPCDVAENKNENFLQLPTNPTSYNRCWKSPRKDLTVS